MSRADHPESGGPTAALPAWGGAAASGGQRVAFFAAAVAYAAWLVALAVVAVVHKFL
jgi:hypothetical protein